MRCLPLVLAVLVLGLPLSESFAQEVEVSPALRKLLEAKTDKGDPVIGKRERQYFEALSAETKKMAAEVLQKQLVTSATHLRDLLSVKLPEKQMQVVFSDNCVLCHSDPESQSADTLFSLDPKAHGSKPHMDLKALLSGTHFRQGLSCAGCHGGKPTQDGPEHEFVKEWPSSRDGSRDWIPKFCARCHEDVARMNVFKPDMPTDQFAKYKMSRHGQSLLGDRNSKAAECVSCHGSHGILPVRDPNSQVHPRRVAETCNACHGDASKMADVRTQGGKPMPTNQFTLYKDSVHGKALLGGKSDAAPSCSGCHGSHSGIPAKVASIRQSCRLCHGQNAELFDGSKHKTAFGKLGFAECVECHGNHGIEKPSDELMSAANGLCRDCHEKHAKGNPLCVATASHFYDVLTGLASYQATIPGAVTLWGARGLDVEPLETSAQELSDAVKHARSGIHAFDRAKFDATADEGVKARAKIKDQLRPLESEYRTRRIGLAASIFFALILAGALYLRVRRSEG